MAALAEAPMSVTPAAFGCSRFGCSARGTACKSCLNRAGEPGMRVALTDGQASFILRTKLAAACVAGEPFESAWTLATAEIIARSAEGQARTWRVALEAVRGEFAEAYRRKRMGLGQARGASRMTRCSSRR